MSITPQRTLDLAVIVVAAGSGERLNAGVPKAFTKISGQTLVEYAIRTITSIDEPGQLVLVVPEGYAATAIELIAEVSIPDHWTVSVEKGGRERHESVRSGIHALHESIQTVLVHDAARPLAPRSLFVRVAKAVRESGGSVVPALEVSDTLKRFAPDGIVLETAPRAELVAVQTPQGFPREALVAAHAAVTHDETADLPTDDAEVIQRAGGTVRLIEGSHYAHKVTVPADVHMLEGLFIARGKS